jgi:hypothetical protein
MTHFPSSIIPYEAKIAAGIDDGTEFSGRPTRCLRFEECAHCES